MQVSTGRILDVKISDWRLNLLISSKFRFTNDMTELSDPDAHPRIISFSVGLARDSTYNELTVKVQSVPGESYISEAQALFKKINEHSATLIFTLTADSQRY
jgi:hypothetical protein